MAKTWMGTWYIVYQVCACGCQPPSSPGSSSQFTPELLFVSMKTGHAPSVAYAAR